MKPPKDSLIDLNIAGLVPTEGGCATFLTDGEKTIMFYIDPSTGASINAALTDLKAPRPLTHDLFRSALRAFGGRVREMVITRMEDDVFYTSLVLEAENELLERQIIKLDARPSDAIALSVRDDAPMYMLASLWSTLPDVSDLLAKIKESGGPDDMPA